MVSIIRGNSVHCWYRLEGRAQLWGSTPQHKSRARTPWNFQTEKLDMDSVLVGANLDYLGVRAEQQVN